MDFYEEVLVRQTLKYVPKMPYNTYSKKLPRKINKHMIIYYRVSILINYMCTIYSKDLINIDVQM